MKIKRSRQTDKMESTSVFYTYYWAVNISKYNSHQLILNKNIVNINILC